MLQQIGTKSLLAGLGLLALGAVGCSVDVYAPPPRERVVVEEAPPPPPPGPYVEDSVVVEDAPPEPQYEDPGPQPGVGFVFVTGEYVRVGDHWEWHRGHWDRPPEGRHRWVASRYERRGGGYVRITGHWE